MNTRLVLLFSLVSLSISCSESVSCLGNLVCTEELRILTLTIQDSSGNPIVLDSAYSTHTATGTVFQDIEDGLLGPSNDGTYVIWSDIDFDVIKKRGSDIRFEGWLGGQQVISQTFTVGHDCCHIELLDGETNIVLNR